MHFSMLFLVVFIVSTTAVAVTMSPWTSSTNDGGRTTTVKMSEKTTRKIYENNANITTTVFPHGNTTVLNSTATIATKYIAPAKMNFILFTSTIPTQIHEKMNISAEKIGLVVANRTDKKNAIDNWGIRNIVQFPTIQKIQHVCPNGKIRNNNGDCVEDANGYN